MVKTYDLLARWSQKLYSLNKNAIYSAIQRRNGKWRHIPAVDLPSIVQAEAHCCFVLSTGRCGTELLTRILEKCPNVDVQHQPTPELIYLSKLAYWEAEDRSGCMKLAAFHARYDIIEDCYIRNVIYVETNNRITFYAPYLAELFPNAQFIHLIRHPGDFVRSGLRRGYYVGSDTDRGRIVPHKNSSIAQQWLLMSQIEKIAWLWNETNSYIEVFKNNVPTRKIMSVRAEDLFSNVTVTEKICEFIGVKPPTHKWIGKRIAKPTNIQLTGNISDFTKWPEEKRELLRKWTPLAQHYEYII
ncbi:MAG: sulfotransferase [Caldilineaceae bacterium]